jgi:hypothetical protein
MRHSNRDLIRAAAMILTMACAAATVTPSWSAPAGQVSADRTGATHRAAAGMPSPRFGGSVFREQGETYREAYKRVIRRYGGSLDIVRMFFPGLPGSWSSIEAKIDDTPVAVSFRADPAAVLAGTYDAQFRTWFAQAPTGRPTFWTYWHEPEDDNVNQVLYRRAWAHLRELANQADNRQLRATLILMCWTLSPNSGRDWRDYYPGDDVIRILAFDCYNTGRKNGVYRDPARILRPVSELAKSLDKPWGIAEFGTTVIESDGGVAGRATWLRQYANFVRDNSGRFATYFDSVVGIDYRLRDEASRSAWEDIVQRR